MKNAISLHGYRLCSHRFGFEDRTTAKTLHSNDVSNEVILLRKFHPCFDRHEEQYINHLCPIEADKHSKLEHPRQEVTYRMET